jgi:hypothetical protein
VATAVNKRAIQDQHNTTKSTACLCCFFDQTAAIMRVIEVVIDVRYALALRRIVDTPRASSRTPFEQLYQDGREAACPEVQTDV